MKIKLAKNELIHFVGIGGIGMSGLALIMNELGFRVQGSDISNNKNIDRLKKNKIKVFIGHNKKNEIEIRKIYEENKIENYLFSFDKSLHNKLNLYDLAITRSGASTISELAYSSVPFIAIPFPFAKDDHQYFNAKYYFDKNCCWLFEQKDFDEKKIVNLISNLVKDERKYCEKKENIIKFSYQNTWNNINQKLIDLLNEN